MRLYRIIQGAKIDKMPDASGFAIPDYRDST
jgi:hypothetical protein